VIEVVAIAGLVTVQDAGRPGHMHEGVPPGGALVPELLAAANEAAGNRWDAAALEVFGSIAVVSDAPLLVAADGEAARRLGAGETWSVASRGARVRYVAIRGGIEARDVLGGRGTLLAAGVGGHEGRPLRRGDRLAATDSSASLQFGSSARENKAEPRRRPGAGRFDPGALVRVVPGPDSDRFAPGAIDVLVASEFEVSPHSDRTGVRLRGVSVARVDADTGVSGPMVRGAIQVPASGEPIVLGPDHPTTGGYPVVATVVSSDVGALMARSVGAKVRFSLVRHGTAHGGIAT
jgi:5-oxoprolinase (ATP-hydrolysing) subunit C